MTHNIKIVDSGLDRYLLEPNEIVTLGRQWDSGADEIAIERPEAEKDSLCVMIINDISGNYIDHIIMNTDSYTIKSNVSMNKYIKISFRFLRQDGYSKGSEILIGKFLTTQKPYDFKPDDPAQKEDIDYLVGFGFTDSKLDGNELQFFNMFGNKVVAFDLSPFVQAQSDLGETDQTAETFVKGKKTSNLVNDGEDGTSPFATQKWTQENAGKIDSISVNGKNVPADENKNVNLEVLEKTGGTISGNLSVQGNLNIAGTTVTKDTETLLVKDNIVVTNSNKVELLNLSGLAINKNANQTYGIMYDPTTDSVKLGLGSIDEAGKFTFSENGNPVAVRADSSLLVDGHLIKWDATNNRFVDSGKSVDDFVLKGEIKQDYQIVTAEPTDKSQGKMVYENVSSPVIPQYDSAKTTVYGSPQNLIDKYINNSENWTWDDVRNLDWLASTTDSSTNQWNYVIPIAESIYDILYSNINSPLKLKVKTTNGIEEKIANFEGITESAGAIWAVSDYSFMIQTLPSPILYGGISGVEEPPHIPCIGYQGTQSDIEILSISSQDGTEIWKNVGKSSVFNITNLKIADGTQYNPLKQLINEGMQEKLTAGTGITIENNVISATAQETQIDNTTITKTADGKLQAVGLQDETDSKTLTAHDIWLACSIEREV